MPIVYTRKRLRAPRPTTPPSSPQQPRKPASTTAPTPPRPPRPKRRKFTQLHLDAGQSDLVKTCPECGMLYTPGRDDTLHTRYHRSRTPLPRWSAATATSRSLTHAGLTLHLVTSACTARRVDRFVSSRLGTVIDFPDGKWLAVVGVSRGLVRAFCLVERVYRARVLERGALKGDFSAVMGVRKVWVDASVRRKGIAGRMLDEARVDFLYGAVIEKRDIAFSAPTSDGESLARQFCGRVLVYDTGMGDGLYAGGDEGS